LNVAVSDLYAGVAGDGPAVALIHAGICDGRMWDPQWETLTREHRVLRYDMRGFGRSPIGAGRFSNARDLLELLERHGFDRASLVGVSMGGRVALEATLARPELVEALVLVGSGLPGDDASDELKAAWAEEEAALGRGDLDAAVEMSLRTWVDGPRRSARDVDPAVRRRVAEMQRRAYELQKPVQETAEEDLLVTDLAERVGEIEAPTLVVVGAEDMPAIHLIAERLAREIPGAQRATIPGAAHVPSLERPAEFDELVLGFLDAVH
jgi:pimeloyl-ACP methyl ester carboxylesterase